MFCSASAHQVDAATRLDCKLSCTACCVVAHRQETSLGLTTIELNVVAQFSNIMGCSQSKSTVRFQPTEPTNVRVLDAEYQATSAELPPEQHCQRGSPPDAEDDRQYSSTRDAFVSALDAVDRHALVAFGVICSTDDDDALMSKVSDTGRSDDLSVVSDGIQSITMLSVRPSLLKAVADECAGWPPMDRLRHASNVVQAKSLRLSTPLVQIDTSRLCGIHFPDRPHGGQSAFSEDYRQLMQPKPTSETEAESNPQFDQSLEHSRRSVASLWPKTLVPEDAKVATWCYCRVSMFHRELNKSLRGSEEAYPAVTSAICDAIKNAPNNESTELDAGLKVYRGQDSGYGEYKKGSRITWRAFASTSRDPVVARRFGGAVLFEITVPPRFVQSMKLASVEGLARTAEDEWLMMPGAQLKVVEVNLKPIEQEGSSSSCPGAPLIRLEVVNFDSKWSSCAFRSCPDDCCMCQINKLIQNPYAHDLPVREKLTVHAAVLDQLGEHQWRDSTGLGEPWIVTALAKGWTKTWERPKQDKMSTFEWLAKRSSDRWFGHEAALALLRCRTPALFCSSLEALLAASAVRKCSNFTFIVAFTSCGRLTADGGVGGLRARLSQEGAENAVQSVLSVALVLDGRLAASMLTRAPGLLRHEIVLGAAPHHLLRVSTHLHQAPLSLRTNLRAAMLASLERAQEACADGDPFARKSIDEFKHPQRDATWRHFDLTDFLPE